MKSELQVILRYVITCLILKRSRKLIVSRLDPLVKAQRVASCRGQCSTLHSHYIKILSLILLQKWKIMHCLHQGVHRVPYALDGCVELASIEPLSRASSCRSAMESVGMSLSPSEFSPGCTSLRCIMRYLFTTRLHLITFSILLTPCGPSMLLSGTRFSVKVDNQFLRTFHPSQLSHLNSSLSSYTV